MTALYIFHCQTITQKQTLNRFQSQFVCEGKYNTVSDLLHVKTLTVSLLAGISVGKQAGAVTDIGSHCRLPTVTAVFPHSGLLHSAFWRGAGYRRFEAMSVLEDGNWMSRNVSNLCRVTSQKIKDPTK
jgi:hypothetical protein